MQRPIPLPGCTPAEVPSERSPCLPLIAFPAPPPNRPARSSCTWQAPTPEDPPAESEAGGSGTQQSVCIMAASAVDATVAKLLDFGQPLDVGLLDATIAAFYGASSNEEVRPRPAADGSCLLRAPPAAASRGRLVAGSARLTAPPSAQLAQRVAAEAVLKKVQEHPDAWTRVDAILEHSKNQQTRFFGLQVLRQGRQGGSGAGGNGAARATAACARGGHAALFREC